MDTNRHESAKEPRITRISRIAGSNLLISSLLRHSSLGFRLPAADSSAETSREGGSLVRRRVIFRASVSSAISVVLPATLPTKRSPQTISPGDPAAAGPLDSTNHPP